MTESEATKKSRLRWVNLGEAIAIAALILSGLGLWHELNKPESKPVVVEKRSSIPLALRGRVADDGKRMEISPIEDSHALQSLTVTVPTSGSVIEVGSDGGLSARAVESALNRTDDSGKGPHRQPVRIAARYVEAGADKSATGSYVVTYRWESGGLFGGRSLRLEAFSR